MKNEIYLNNYINYLKLNLKKSTYDDKIIKFGQNEIFADAGCFDCGTDIEFIKRCPDYKKIIAFEPDINNIETCRKAIKKRKISNFNKYCY